MNANGNAVTTTRFCIPRSASCPPESKITTAIPAIHKTQNVVIHGFGLGLPFCDSCEFTNDAESAVVTKKIISTTMMIGATTCAPGNWSSTTKKISSGAGIESAVPSGAIE